MSADETRSEVVRLRWDQKGNEDYVETVRDGVNRLLIGENTYVRVHLTNFNFLRYRPVFEVETRQLESFSFLNTLWEQVLGLGDRLADPLGLESTEPEVDQLLADWRMCLFGVQDGLSSVLSRYPNAGLTDAEVRQVGATLSSSTIVGDARGYVAARDREVAAGATEIDLTGGRGEFEVGDAIYFEDVPGLYSVTRVGEATNTASVSIEIDPPLRRAIQAETAVVPLGACFHAFNASTAQDAIDVRRQRVVARIVTDVAQEISPDDIDVFEQIEAQHRAIDAKLATFVSSATLVRDGWRKSLGRKKAGTLVTVSLGAENLADATQDAEPVTLSYLVRSSRPLLLHLGFSYSRLKDAEFDKVRTLGAGDLFSRVKAIDDSEGYVINLSYALHDFDEAGRFRFLATLGTELSKPGDTLFVGGSVLLFDHLVVTSGGVAGTESAGTQKTLDTVAGILDSRELFAAVTQRRAFSWFLGVSFKVY